MPSFIVSIQRSPPDAKPHLEQHVVEAGECASVLDLLFALQRGPMPDLSFRFSCRVGMCGSCAMVVNGREELTCSTLAASLGPRLRIEPLRNLPVVRDLVVDLAPFFAVYRRATPHFIPRPGLDDFYQIPHESAEWKAMDHQPQCIDCGACYSACTLVTLHPRYLGPMALHRALVLITDPRDAAQKERLQIVCTESGAFGCHTLGNCRDVCPRGISPTASIQRLKRMGVFEQVRALFSRVFGGQSRITQ
ncbi:MAG TPA: succinate dehydrogenase/fumarate reductase iron-sulfur subunit [Candidatus Binatia bacterium]|nr:succinate dehydrogenase/fumarate reductase iron-sulfur subunit [Candidatus Binatia bacterium]